jgi:hypothetical protein
MPGENDLDRIPRYVDHPGTIKIAGGTLPKGAGWCAFCYLSRGISPIDFMCIGANANQQATKAMGVFRFLVETKSEFVQMEVAFQPLLFKTETSDPVTKDVRLKSVTIWRTITLERKTK